MPRNNRTTAVTTSLMTDHSSTQSSPSQKSLSPKPTSPFFGSPRFKADPVMSPTSILDSTKRYHPLKNPFWLDTINHPKSPKTPSSGKKQSWDNLESKGIGVALVDHNTANNQTNEEQCNNTSRMVLFGTKLRVQIPPLPNSSVSPTESPNSPTDFGNKTRSPQLLASGTANFGSNTKNSPRVFTGCLSISEMELSEDYTCVISHGPNPKTTHIYDNCIVENYCSWSLDDKSMTNSSLMNNFLSCCYTCKKNLGQRNDIYIYRGEKAFCSEECRYQEMLLDGEEES